MKRLLIGLLAVTLLAGCATPPRTDVPAATKSQQLIDNARTTYVFASLAISTYKALTPCTDNGPKICKQDYIAKQLTEALAAAALAIDLAEAANDVSNAPSTLAKIQAAIDAAMLALKLAQSYGIG